MLDTIIQQHPIHKAVADGVEVYVAELSAAQAEEFNRRIDKDRPLRTQAALVVLCLRDANGAAVFTGDTDEAIKRAMDGLSVKRLAALFEACAKVNAMGKEAQEEAAGN